MNPEPPVTKAVRSRVVHQGVSSPASLRPQ